MNNILQQILNLFSSNNLPSVSENYSEVKVEVVCNNGKVPTEDDFKAVILNLNSRDGLHISILQNDDDYTLVCNYSSEQAEPFSTFLQEINSTILENDFRIIITIEKKKNNQIVSVYYVDEFIKYLNDLLFLGVLFVLDKLFNNKNYIVFEVQDDSFQEFSTKTIKFIPKGSHTESGTINNRTERLNKIRNLCHCSIVSKYKFVPDDFYSQTMSEKPALKKLFDRLTLLYSTIFLFDVFNILDSKIEYKLSGYRTINQIIECSSVCVESNRSYFDIYSWVYDGGNIVDKIGLARNILSLNFEKETLKISDTTFEAIKSGYKIYQKENIKQYIEIRNKISDQLIDLQNKADKIVDSFIGDFKKSLFTVVSFFATVIVIRVVSKGDFAGGFTTEVTLLSIGFLFISLLIMIFAQWEISKQIGRYDEFYKHMKERYEDLLDKSDIKRILNNDKDFISNKKFIEQKRCNYTILWVLSLVILLVIVIALFCINQPCVILDGIFIIIKNIALCFIKNT